MDAVRISPIGGSICILLNQHSIAGDPSPLKMSPLDKGFGMTVPLRIAALRTKMSFLHSVF